MFISFGFSNNTHTQTITQNTGHHPSQSVVDAKQLDLGCQHWALISWPLLCGGSVAMSIQAGWLVGFFCCAGMNDRQFVCRCGWFVGDDDENASAKISNFHKSKMRVAL
jgi:hypothetical protein